MLSKVRGKPSKLKVEFKCENHYNISGEKEIIYEGINNQLHNLFQMYEYIRNRKNCRESIGPIGHNKSF